MRCTVTDCGVPPLFPRSVIVKWPRSDTNGFRSDLEQMVTERAALEFLEDTGFPFSPRILASDLERGVVVMQDLSPRAPLAALLAKRPLHDIIIERKAFARVMGTMNAFTAKKSEQFYSRRFRYGGFNASRWREYGFGPHWQRTEDEMEALGLTMGTSVRAEATAVIEKLRNPGPFLAFSNGDPEPNNFLVKGNDGYLIDFETASYRHALTCATWIHIPGSIWVTVSDPICKELEDEYRKALCSNVPEASDDALFAFGFTAACIAKALDRLRRFPVLDQRRTGDQSRPQMICTLEAAVRVGQRYNVLPNLSGWMAQVADYLRLRWPDADIDGSSAYVPRIRDS